MRWPGRVPCDSPLPPWQRTIAVGEKWGGWGGGGEAGLVVPSTALGQLPGPGFVHTHTQLRRAEPSQPRGQPLPAAAAVSAAGLGYSQPPSGVCCCSRRLPPPPRSPPPFSFLLGLGCPAAPPARRRRPVPAPGPLPAGRRMRSGREGEGLSERPHRAPSPLINFTLLIINFTPVKLAQEERGGGGGEADVSRRRRRGRVPGSPLSPGPATFGSAGSGSSESRGRRRFPFRWMMLLPPSFTHTHPPPHTHPHTLSLSLFRSLPFSPRPPPV